MAFSFSSSSSPSADINVTPLIDVLLVLLIIFMVIVPVVPRGLANSIPQGHAQSSSAPPVVVQVIAGKGGPPSYCIGDREMSFSDLRPALGQMFATRQEHTLLVQADRTLNFARVAAVMSEAQAAGAGPMALGPPIH